MEIIFLLKIKKRNSIKNSSIIKNNNVIIEYHLQKKDKYDYLIISGISPLKKTRLYAKNKFGKNYPGFAI